MIEIKSGFTKRQYLRLCQPDKRRRWRSKAAVLRMLSWVRLGGLDDRNSVRSFVMKAFIPTPQSRRTALAGTAGGAPSLLLSMSVHSGLAAKPPRSRSASGA